MEEASPLLRNSGAVQKSKWKLFAEETKKVGYIAAPMVVVTVSQHLSRVASMMMVGHLGELALSGAAVATSFTNVSGLSLLFGMASALETLCGQAFGAEQYQKLGTYTYASIISLLIVCIPISVLWIFMDKLLIFMGQDPSISVEAGRYAIWLIPTLFPYAILQSLIRYLQTQSLILPMVLSSIAALSFHVPVCWVLVFKANLGIAGAALAIGLSYWLNVILLALYVKYSSTCERTRAAWSGDVLPSVREFFCFAVPSAVMVCLEWWSFEIVVLLSGLLPNPQLETSVLSICLLVASLHYFIPYSIGAAASTRVSNELGAGCPDRARASTWSAMVLSLSEAVISCSILLSFRHVFGYAFSNEKEVVNYLQEISPFVCLLLFMDCIQAVLSVLGVARGSGWQHLGAYVNLGAYYLAGLPMAAVLGFALHLRGKGLWFGLNVGSIVQSILLSLLTCFTNWKRQALSARERMAECGRK
ncbi:protein DETOXIFICATION 14-like isoform X1 [Primulina eburnea]|uniref:protein DETOXIFICATION 14-like isoform X1 n=1 Tax=Primulina eburnea TaxID=1245227 RepID=UPI003C6C4756